MPYFKPGAYLPLAGGTLTGPLTGVALSMSLSGIFGGDVSVNSITVGRGGGASATNTVVGNRSLINNVVGLLGIDNVAVGYLALASNISGSANVAIGSQALVSGVGATTTIAIGSTAGRYFSGAASVIIGNAAGGATTAGQTGTNNTIVGYSAGNTYALTSSNNTYIGQYAGYQWKGDNNIIIQSAGGIPAGGGSGSVFIGFTGTAANYSNEIHIGTGLGVDRIKVDSTGNMTVISGSIYGLNIASGVLTSSTLSATAGGGILAPVFQSSSGRTTPTWVDQFGSSYGLQRAFQPPGHVSIVTPSQSGVLATAAVAFTSMGTTASPSGNATWTTGALGVRAVNNAVSGTYLGTLPRAYYSLTASGTAWTGSAWHCDVTPPYFNTGSLSRGFFFRTRFYIESALSGSVLYIGLFSYGMPIGAGYAQQTPAGFLGLGVEQSGSNFQVRDHNGSGGITVVKDLGTSFGARTATATYDFTMFNPPNSNTVYWSIYYLQDGSRDEGSFTGITQNTTPIYYAYMGMTARNGSGGAGTLSLGLMHMECHSPLGP